MIDYGLPKYDKYRKWIRQAREMGRSWDLIKYGLKNNEEELIKFLEFQRDINWWDINENDWYYIVDLEKRAEEETKDIEYLDGSAMIMGEGQCNATTIPEDPKSSWQLYKKGLLDNGFKDHVVDRMERTTIKILKRLSGDTTTISPIKGLVIGNVQSGKTSNMAAVMAMAADWGWNLFIVLSGTIENLRQQTQSRLLSDLNKPGNLNWYGLEHLSKKPTLGQRAQDLHFEENSKQRYFTVCLKNSGRLKKLIQWLQSDSNKQRQMRILVIDDEADQAGINTQDITKNERKAINRLICNIVNGKDERGKLIETKYKAMNYIGYTATPYANILNEAGEESLYPRDFICTLGVSKEYFGPQQIFGVEGDDYDGMNIVRTINKDELERIKYIHEGDMSCTPNSLKDAICWFLCGVACMRYWGYKKPISMLIHTSQKTNHHEYIAEVVKQWLSSNKKDRICKECEKVWNREIKEFTFENFREQYKDYDRRDEEINKYPDFSIIKENIYTLIDCVSNIKLDSDEQEFEYHDGIHLCIDNCKNNGINEDGMYVRLAYPDSRNMPEFAPAFIVVGGATLSRGLTIEGLISTFFLRSVGQADTLMQMGRWFGYRKGYELIPRLWITSKTNDQFKFLSTLDQELRDEIHHMDTIGVSPSNYGPRVKNTPMYSFIRITAKNRMQSAEKTDMDFSGTFIQTYLFDNDKNILTSNNKVVENFINKLGKPNIRNNVNAHAENTSIWRNIDFKVIEEMLREYKFQQRQNVFNEIESLLNWINKITREGRLKNWNVVLAGKESNSNNTWKLKYTEVNKVRRTRKLDAKDESIINIGVLRDPKDLIADIDLVGQSVDVIREVRSFKAKDAKKIRDMAGYDSVPQLLIYIIDKNSQSRKNENRRDLNAAEDIVGLCVNIPGGRKGVGYATTVSIPLKNNIFNDEGDLEE